jgi:hypothetical protein
MVEGHISHKGGPSFFALAAYGLGLIFARCEVPSPRVPGLGRSSDRWLVFVALFLVALVALVALVSPRSRAKKGVARADRVPRV